MDFQQLLSRRRAFAIAALLGLLILILVIKFKSAPPLLPAQELAHLVNVIELKPQKIAPEIRGYGHVKPKSVWKAVAEVSGKITYRHPELYKGRFLPAGTHLLSIDKTDYEIRLAQAKADLLAIDGQLKGKSLEKQNLKLSLKIERKLLDISKVELKRKQKLVAKKLISLSELDDEQQRHLAQLQKVQDYENRLTLLPNDVAVLQAQRKQIQAQAEQAERELVKTDIYLPYDAQIAEVNVENAQAVATQQVLLTAYGVSVMSVNAQVSLSDMSVLMANVRQQKMLKSSHVLDAATVYNVEALPIEAGIRLLGQGYAYQWSAKVKRISDSVEQSQATVGVILEIEQDLSEPKRKQPPLFNGMFVSAQLKGVEAEHWLVPEGAVHQNRIYLMNEQQRLQIMPIEVLFRQNNMVAIQPPADKSLQLVTNDLIPAIAGMKLRVVEAVEKR